jgi:hypothetical protein
MRGPAQASPKRASVRLSFGLRSARGAIAVSGSHHGRSFAVSDRKGMNEK